MAKLVHGDREIEVLHRLLNGNSMRAIGKHMKLSSTTIIRTRDIIVKQMMMGRKAPFSMLSKILLVCLTEQ